jgi:hypothetical protein
MTLALTCEHWPATNTGSLTIPPITPSMVIMAGLTIRGC